MSKHDAAHDSVSYETTLRVRDACLCFQARQAARALARRFDEALRPLGLTNGQFSLMMALNRPEPPGIGEVATGLAMDRTSLTAMLKPLARRGLVAIAPDAKDRRGRRIRLTQEGHALLAHAVPVWERTLSRIEAAIGGATANRLRKDLRAVARPIPLAPPRSRA